MSYHVTGSWTWKYRRIGKKNKEQKSADRVLYTKHIKEWQIFSACRSTPIEYESLLDYRTLVQSRNLVRLPFVANDNANAKLRNWKCAAIGKSLSTVIQKPGIFRKSSIFFQHSYGRMNAKLYESLFLSYFLFWGMWDLWKHLKPLSENIFFRIAIQFCRINIRTIRSSVFFFFYNSAAMQIIRSSIIINNVINII